MPRAVRWDLIADPRRYQKGFKEAEATTKRFHGTVTKMVGLIGGAFAAVEVGGFLKDAISEAREAAKVTRQTNAVIKATGGAANVTAKDVNRLADALSVKVGVDDEVIAAGENMLLTFKGVRNEAGKNNDVFNQATKVALDMTAALHQGEVTQQGLEKSNIMLGKALNDPIKGITSLTRVGVTFTKAQKDQIKALVEAGDKMGAQKVILKELASEFGGAAEASADPWQKVTVAFANVKEEIGTALLPALNSAATFITSTLIPAAEKWWKHHAPAFRNAFKQAGEFATAAWTVLKDNLLPIVEETATKFDKDLDEAIVKVTGAWRDNHAAIIQLGKDLKDLKPVWDVLIWLIGRLATDEIPDLIRQIGLIGRAIHLMERVAITTFQRFYSGVITFEINFLTAMRAVVDSVPGGSRSGFHAKLQRGIDQLSGFRTSFNKQMDGLKDEDVSIDVKGVWEPPRALKGVKGVFMLAAGGPVSGPGTATSDSIPAMLSTGEHVLSAREVQGMGGHSAVEQMRKQARGFAQGGIVDAALNLPPAAGISGRVGRAINRLAERIDRLTMRVALPGNPTIPAFLRHADALPYVWGAVGPNGYDCSGLAGEVLNRHLGLASYTRRFTTGTIRAGMYGLKPGLGGVLNLGVTAGTGHMAGSYMGMGFEAESSRTGIKIGAAASPPGSFARTYHLARGGPADRRLLAAYATLAGVNVGGDPGRLRVNGYGTFDRGGWLRPGYTMAYNGTGRAEPVGVDYDRLGQAVAHALRREPPQVAVVDVHSGLLRRKRTTGTNLGLT